MLDVAVQAQPQLRQNPALRREESLQAGAAQGAQLQPDLAARRIELDLTQLERQNLQRICSLKREAARLAVVADRDGAGVKYGPARHRGAELHSIGVLDVELHDGDRRRRPQRMRPHVLQQRVQKLWQLGVERMQGLGVQKRDPFEQPLDIGIVLVAQKVCSLLVVPRELADHRVKELTLIAIVLAEFLASVHQPLSFSLPPSVRSMMTSPSSSCRVCMAIPARPPVRSCVRATSRPRISKWAMNGPRPRPR